MAGNAINVTMVLKGDDNSFKKITASAEGLKKSLTGVLAEADKFNHKAINFAAITTGIENAQRSIQQMMTALHSLTDMYAEQELAETRLATVMRQRMGATEADIKSVKELASAQQELGVIGDEVQLQGVQQLATFLSQKSSIEALLPAMNNLLAQQKGINASGADAVSIGNLMGKAMQGQTSALRRVGITFTDAQDKVLKYGDESERAAMLAEVIRQNVGDMNAEIAKTDVGKAKQLENAIGDIKEQIGGALQWAAPWLAIASNAVVAAGGVVKLITTVKALAAAMSIANIRAKLLPALLYTGGASAKRVAVIMRSLAAQNEGYSASAARAALRTYALKGALVSLAAATGVGLLIAAISSAIGAMMGAADNAADSIKELDNGMESWSDTLRSVEQSAASYAGQASEALNKLYSVATDESKSRDKRLEAARKMQQMYPAYFGNLSTEAIMVGKAKKAYDDLAESILKAARAKAGEELMYQNQLKLLAEKEKRIKQQKELEEKERAERGARASYNAAVNAKPGSGPAVAELGSTGIGGTYSVNAGNRSKGVEVMRAEQTLENTRRATRNARAVIAATDKNISALEDQQGRLQEIINEGGDRGILNVAETAAGAAASVGNTANTVVEKTRLEEIDALVKSLKNDYVSADEEKRKTINGTINTLLSEKRAIENLMAEAEAPAVLDTLDAYDKEISRFTAKLRGASAAESEAINKTIDFLQRERKELELSSHAALRVDEIKTYEQLNGEISYYTSLLQTAGEEERKLYTKAIKGLNELKTAWDEALKTPPEAADKVKTLEEIDNAVAYYSEKQKKAGAEEYYSLQQTINAYEKKREAFTRVSEIMDMRKEVDEISSFTGKSFKVRIESIGFEELTSKIEKLQRMLSMDGVTEQQRKDITSLIGTYTQWRAQSVNSFSAMRKGYESIKGVGNGIKSITDALSGNKNAWEMVTGVVDAALQIYDSITGIIGIVNALGIAHKGTAAATMAEGAAATATAVEQQAATDAELVNDAMKIAANSELTASYSAAAAAATFAAHAYIPFAGTGIAQRFIAQQQATVLACAIPKFAEGGIAYGPTLGIFGEYAGASSNPEVVAPLDKLRDIIEPSGIPGGAITLRIKGRDLVGVMANETRITSRSGRRTNIKI